MSRRRHEVGGSKRKPARPKPGRGPFGRRRRSFMWRASTRGATLAFLGVAVLAIAGVSIASALTGGGSSVRPDAASTPNPVVTTAAPSPSASVRGPLPPSTSPTPSPVVKETSSPRPQPTSSPTRVASPKPAVVSPKPSPSPTHSSCPGPAQRAQQARRLLQHQDALPQNVTLITDGPRQGLLGSSSFPDRTLTLYVRSCPDEPLLQLAVVWGYEAGQFIKTEVWDSATRSHWNQLRGSSFTSSAQFKQDAASVYAYWQTGSTSYWNSPVPPPSFSKLSQLVPYLKTS